MDGTGSGGVGGFSPIPIGVLMNCVRGNFVDLSNMPDTGSILASAAIDTTRLTNPMVKIDFNCILSYRIVVLEELDLVFTLFRVDNRYTGRLDMQELASWPIKFILDQNLTGAEGEQVAFTVLEKSESFTLSYCDQQNIRGNFSYVIKVNSNFFNITSAVIQPGFLSLIAQSDYS